MYFNYLTWSLDEIKEIKKEIPEFIKYSFTYWVLYVGKYIHIPESVKAN